MNKKLFETKYNKIHNIINKKCNSFLLSYVGNRTVIFKFVGCEILPYEIKSVDFEIEIKIEDILNNTVLYCSSYIYEEYRKKIYA